MPKFAVVRYCQNSLNEEKQSGLLHRKVKIAYGYHFRIVGIKSCTNIASVLSRIK